MIQDIPDWGTAIRVAKKELFGNEKPNKHINGREPTNFQEVAAIIGKATELLLISKNQKYGKGNILTATRFGMSVEQGLLLRENDKTERIINAINGIDLGKEGMLESFGDKVGYAAIGIMLQHTTKDGKTWYELPIEEES